MRYKIGDFVCCDSKDNKIYCVVWTGEETWYIYYILRELENGKEDTLLADFVDSKFRRVRGLFFRKKIFYIYNFVSMRTFGKILWEIIKYILIMLLMCGPVLGIFLLGDFIVDLQVEFFQEGFSFWRFLFFVYFIFINSAYFFGDLVQDFALLFKKKKNEE